MAFDSQRFMTCDFKDRTAEVPVPGLKAFFPEDEKPVWVVRGLTGLECALSKQAVQANQNVEAVLKGLQSKLPKEVADAVVAMTQSDDEKVPDELVQQYCWIRFGSVSPVCDHDMAMRLARHKPLEFALIWKQIMALTGDGSLGE